MFPGHPTPTSPGAGAAAPPRPNAYHPAGAPGGPAFAFGAPSAFAGPAPGAFPAAAPTAAGFAPPPAGPPARSPSAGPLPSTGFAPPPTGAPPAGFGAPPPAAPPAGFGAPPAAAPPAGFGAPPAGFGAPPAGFGAPPTGASPAGFGAPPAGFGAPPAAPPAGAPPTGAPPAGFGAPPAGFGAPPAAAPPAGLGAPPAGAPPAGFGAPPAGFGAPPTGAPPAGFGAPAAGAPPAGAPPAGFGAPPTGAPPAGFGAPPTGAPPAGAPPAGFGAPAAGAPPAGAPPAGFGAPPAGFGAPPAGAPPAGFGAPPAGFGAPPAGLGAPPAGFGGAPSTGTPSAAVPPAGFGAPAATGFGAAPAGLGAPAAAAPPAGMGGGAPAGAPPAFTAAPSGAPSGGAVEARPAAAAEPGFRQGTEGRFWGGGPTTIDDVVTTRKRQAYPKNPSIPETIQAPPGAAPPPAAASALPAAAASSGAAASFAPAAVPGLAAAAAVSPYAAAPGGAIAPGAFPAMAGGALPGEAAAAFAPGGVTGAPGVVPCEAGFLSFTTGLVPNSSKLASQIGAPLGVVVQPLACTGVTQPPVINFGAVGVIRCGECRAYINPYCQFTSGGRSWTCSLCRASQKVPEGYYCATDSAGVRYDIASHPELTRGAIEFVATQQYTYRPPQAPAYFFVLDVSYGAVQSGLVFAALQAIKTSLDRLPAHERRARVGIITFDSMVHSYSLNAGRSQPCMLVVPDLTDLFLPTAYDELLVNLTDCRKQFDGVLDLIAACFQDNRNAESCLDAALRFAAAVMRKNGGKIVVFQNALSSGPQVPLRSRAAPAAAAMNSAKEQTFRQPADPLFQTIGLDASKYQITFDLFVLSTAGHTDLASLTMLCQVTGGHLHFYETMTSGHSAAQECERLYYDVSRSLSGETGFEACLRVRVSSAFKVSKHFGHFFMKNVDLMSVPVVDAETTFAAELQLGKRELAADVRQMVVQAALLYTTSTGERRIRVFTHALPVTNSVPHIVRSVQLPVVMALSAKSAGLRASNVQLAEVRESLIEQCAAMMKGCASAAAALGLNLPPNLSDLPLLTLGLTKCAALTNAGKLTVDDRVAALTFLRGRSTALIQRYLAPLFIPLHTLSATDGLPDPATGQVGIPAALPPSSEKIERHGVYLLDNGLHTYVWFGPDTPDALVQQLLNKPSLQHVEQTLTQLPVIDTPYSTRVVAIVNAVRAQRFPYGYQPLTIIKNSPSPSPLELSFFAALVADRSNGTPSLAEFNSRILPQKLHAK